MDPATQLSSKTKRTLAKIGLGDKALKVIFLVGIILFTASIFLFRFELLSSLTIDETARLNSLTSLKTFLNNPTDPIQGFLQWTSLKALPSHQIFALRLPSALMIGLSFTLIAVTLYLKFRNRYLPYIFAILAATSPWAILLAHQGYLPGIDILLALSIIFCTYFIITKSDITNKWKYFAYLAASGAIGILALQPFGIIYFAGLIVFHARSTQLKLFTTRLSRGQRAIAILPLLIIPLVNIAFLYINPDNWQLLSGYSLLKNPAHIPLDILYNAQSIFGMQLNKGLTLGTGRPDFLLIGALSLTIYEIFKKRQGRAALVIGLLASIVISALYGAPTSIILIVPFTVAILGLALANMIRIIDEAFPRNPYPRNIARSGMLILVCILASLNIYTFITATIRENTPTKINLVTANRNK